MLDLDGRVLTWNAGAARLKGYLPHEIIGSSFERFYPAEDVARGWPQEELRRAAADGRIEDEGWRLRKDGSRFWASVVITALRDDVGRAGRLRQGHARPDRAARARGCTGPQRRAAAPDDPGGQGLRDLHARPGRHRAVVELGRRGDQGLHRERGPRAQFRDVLHRRGRRRGKAAAGTGPRTTRRSRGDAGLARAQGRQPVLGQRGHHAGLRRAPGAARLRQGHARSLGAAPIAGARALEPAAQRVPGAARP